jgi:hypothetical protein
MIRGVGMVGVGGGVVCGKGGSGVEVGGCCCEGIGLGWVTL